MSVARIGVIVFSHKEGNLDWRPCGVQYPNGLPSDAVLEEITWVSDETGEVDTVVFHGFGPDSDHYFCVVAVRNEAIQEMVDGDSW